jgi:hypothetical protein
MRVLSGIVAVAVLALAAQSLSAAPPYDGYTNPSWLYDPSPYGFWITRVKIMQGTTTLLDNASANTPGYSGTPRCHTFYSGVTPANMVPGVQHQLQVTVGAGSYTMGVAAWIDYTNDGDFLDTSEAIGTSGPVSQGTGATLTINFVPPAAAGVLRLRVRAAYSQVPNHSTNQFSYGESEDYLLNMGFAISTTSPLPTGAQSDPYGPVDITATNGATPYIWQYSTQGYLKSGSLPTGMTAVPNGNALRISGTPQVQGTFNFTVEVHDNAAKTAEKQFSITIFPPPAQLPFTDNFSTDKGWQLSGPWQRAAAQAFSQATPPMSQPGTDHTPDPNTDNMILGDTIGSPYKYAANDSQTYWAVSPPFSGQGKTNVRLRFWRWLGLAIGSTAKIEATNNGSTWVNIWTSISGTTSGANATATWGSVYYDLSAVCAGFSVCQIRIGIGPAGADTSTGWSIDDLVIEEPGYDLEVKEGGATGTQIYDNDPVGGLRNMGTFGTSTTSPPLVIHITNQGPSNITFSNGTNPYITKTGNEPYDFILDSSGMLNPLPPGQSCYFTIKFWRATTGTSTATFNLFHNAAYSGTSPFEINVQATAAAPTRILEAHLGSPTGTPILHGQSPAGTARDFGTRDINAGASAPITIFLTNVGTATMTVTSPYMQGAAWSEYVINSAGYTSNLAPGASTSFEVAFDPAYLGTRNAEVQVGHNGTTGATPYIILVTGEGTSSGGAAVTVHEGTVSGPAIGHDAAAVSPPRNFGDVMVGNSSAPITITIENSGGANLTPGMPVLGGTNPGDFSLGTGGFSTNLVPGATTSFTITFTPTSVGVKLATVTFTHNDTSVTSPFIVNVRGNGVTTAPSIRVRETNATGTQLANPAPATGILDFGGQDVNSGPTAAAVIYVENAGTASLTLGTPSFQTTTTQFLLTTTGFSGSLAPGASATFSITFDPDTVGTHTAVVQFTHNDATAGTPFVLNLTGDGLLNAPIIEVREGSTVSALVTSGAPAMGTGRDCGTVDVGAGNTIPVTVVIMNTGNQNLILSTPTLSGVNASDFVLNTAGMIFSVPPGSDTQFNVAFDPLLAGMKDCQVEFTQNDPGAPTPFIVRFVGTATDPNAVQITTPDLPAGMPESQYGPMAMAAIQGTTPYVWSVYSGNLPPGLSLSPGGVISGTPTGFGGNYQVIIRVADQTGATNEKTYTLVVTSANGSRKADSGCTAGNSGSHTALVLLALLGMLALGVRSVRRRA